MSCLIDDVMVMWQVVSLLLLWSSVMLMLRVDYRCRCVVASSSLLSNAFAVLSILVMVMASSIMSLFIDYCISEEGLFNNEPRSNECSPQKFDIAGETYWVVSVRAGGLAWPVKD